MLSSKILNSYVIGDNWGGHGLTIDNLASDNFDDGIIAFKSVEQG